MTGTRLLLTLALELRRRGLKRGLAAACIGGGQGIAAIIERCDGAPRLPEASQRGQGPRKCFKKQLGAAICVSLGAVVSVASKRRAPSP